MVLGPLQVLQEAGPPHMKSFAVRVAVGEFAGEGEGKSKKIAKKLAAAMVLEELRKLPHVPTVEKMLPRIKKKPKSIVKVTTPLTLPCPVPVLLIKPHFLLLSHPVSLPVF